MEKDDINILEIISKVSIHKPKIKREGSILSFTLPDGIRFKSEIIYSPWLYNYYSTTLLIGNKPNMQHIKFVASRKIKKQLYTIVEALFLSQEDITKIEIIKNLK
jgi:hypothetical protein